MEKKMPDKLELRIEIFYTNPNHDYLILFNVVSNFSLSLILQNILIYFGH